MSNKNVNERTKWTVYFDYRKNIKGRTRSETNIQKKEGDDRAYYIFTPSGGKQYLKPDDIDKWRFDDEEKVLAAVATHDAKMNNLKNSTPALADQKVPKPCFLSAFHCPSYPSREAYCARPCPSRLPKRQSPSYESPVT